MALLDEDKLQGNIINILSILRKQDACSCEQVATAMWANSSLAGIVFVTVLRNGKIKVYDQPGGTEIKNYGDITP